MPQTAPSTVTARPAARLTGRLRPPGDKSISHRAVMFASIARGDSTLSGLLEGEDVRATLRAAEAFGARTERLGEGSWRIAGAPDWRSPDAPLDLGNSGTSARLLTGLAAGRGVEVTLDGDESLRSRPMERVAEPLRLMGASIETREGRLPLSLSPARLTGIAYETPVASAQIKSAILLAGLGAEGDTAVTEPAASRDHTERMLPVFGGAVQRDGLTARLTGGQRLSAADIAVPADPSSAAFLIAAALITQGSDVTVTDILLNPRRAGVFRAWEAMGADLQTALDDGPGEPSGALTARSCALTPIHVTGEQVSDMIDEIPILAVTAAFADGESRFEGLAELRVKESDRLAAISELLRAAGVETETGEDWLMVGGRGPDGVKGGGLARAHHDHRIAMSALILGLASREGMTIDDASMIATSYPSFFDDLAALGAGSALS